MVQRNGGTVTTEDIKYTVRATVGTVNIDEQWARRNRGTVGTQVQRSRETEEQ